MILELYKQGVIICFFSLVGQRVIVDSFNYIAGNHIFYKNLRKIYPYLSDDKPVYIRYFNLTIITALLSLTSWIGVLYCTFTTLRESFAAFSVMPQYSTEEAKQYAMPLFINPMLSPEQVFAYKVILDKLCGYTMSQCIDALNNMRDEGVKFDSIVAIYEIEQLGFFTKDEMFEMRAHLSTKALEDH